MWPSAAGSSTAARHINCGLPPEFFFVAPASSFQHHHHAEAGGGSAAAATINFDPHSLNTSSAIGVIPLLTATPCLAGGADDDLLNSARNRGGAAAAMQLWQNQQGQNPSTSSSTGGVASSSGGGVGRPSSSIGTTTCQDCGNQAKKDCSHRRCRTCCKSRGYDCTTHVKSTWVPAARRRERQLMTGNPATGAGSSQSTSGSKKPRLGGASQTTSHTSTSNNTPPRSFETSSSHQVKLETTHICYVDASFKDSLPGQVRAPAVFKCVRVTALDDGEDEYAYQAVVRIGGHVFKGFLYDQGVEGRDGLPNLSELHLGGGGGDDHIYAASGGGLLGGSSYGNPIN
ncbi:protein lateral root primordium 1 [Phtheirospermum japonicum]|uniref:Protein lateral root primordium 1 n=1 Tax=Phtheirospermum japonicum TaxID=374723 RepID=A0A830CZ92_9LAMI|nr:protein lateral root primordium 1 [Phtheirospermum japonicum]